MKSIINRIFSSKIIVVIGCILVVVFFVFYVSTSLPSTGSVSKSISAIKSSSNLEQSLAKVLAISSEQYVCIIGPYTDHVEERNPFNIEINKLLSKRSSIFSEGRWVFVQKINESWFLEEIWLREVNLKKMETLRGERVSYICDDVKNIALTKSSINEFIFKVKDSK